MTQVSTQAPVVQLKPQANIYTILIIIAALVLAVALGVMLYHLMAAPPNGYGMSLGQIFDPTYQGEFAPRK